MSDDSVGQLALPARLADSGEGTTVLAVGASGVVWIFSFAYHITYLLFLPLFRRRSDTD